MKKIFSVFALAVMVSAAAFAQDAGKESKKGDKDQWRERVRAEQVAMITSELDLTEAEAQKFWPVYNEVQNQRREAYGATFEAMKALKDALKDGKDTSALLDKYLKAKKEAADVDEKAITRYKKVLSAEKVAKYVLAEEKFRQRQIGNMGKGPGKNGKDGKAPGKDGKAPKGERPEAPVQE